ncbi:MAG: UTP--glucose-1-phosphate uridylyltransferase [Puniceicoccales bacterium]|jgi:UDP-N-acetylglucosamine/UDP-N-acetylgalactosamine diphosphorylase|nr:UTP--glucose-1-phosphate uridylyltransferase [Puniceicoccales bacterium]
MEKAAKEIRMRFCDFGQGHVFKFWEILSDDERIRLLQQAKNIDLEYFSNIIHSVLHGRRVNDDFLSNIQPAKFIKFPNSEADWQRCSGISHIGGQKIREGKVAVFMVAGGHSTRLGRSVPKGMVPITPIKKKPIFQVFAEKILAAEKKYEQKFHWIILTSDKTHNETIEFFGKNNSFGIENIHFIKQGLMPAIDYDGKIIMEARDKIAMHPNGHGGALTALGQSGMLSMLENAGVDTISYLQVDNPLVRCVDPYLIGTHAKNQAQITSRMVKKLYPEEKVGVFCEYNGRMRVIEYSDLPKECAMARTPAGELQFYAGNTAIHVFDLDFIKRFNGDDIQSEIPYHMAKKIIPTIDNLGEPYVPDSPNGIKLEMFIFDAFPFAERSVIVESNRSEIFSPVKNSEGMDSPKTCKQDQLRLFAHWLLQAGAEIPVDATGLPPFDIEISPMFADNEKDFMKKWVKLENKPAIGPGQYVE